MRCIMPHTTMTTHESMNASPTDLETPVPFIRRRSVRLIIYAGLGLFVLLMVIWPLIEQLKDPDFQKHIAEHRVMVGMSKEQVLEAWGGPQTINTTFTKEGIRPWWRESSSPSNGSRPRPAVRRGGGVAGGEEARAASVAPLGLGRLGLGRSRGRSEPGGGWSGGGATTASRW